MVATESFVGLRRIVVFCYSLTVLLHVLHSFDEIDEIDRITLFLPPTYSSAALGRLIDRSLICPDKARVFCYLVPFARLSSSPLPMSRHASDIDVLQCTWIPSSRQQVTNTVGRFQSHVSAQHGDLDDLARTLEDVHLAIVQWCSVLDTVHTAN